MRCAVARRARRGAAPAADRVSPRQLLAALQSLVVCALGEASDDCAWLDAALPADFHPKLRPRLAKALAQALPGWREASVLSQARAHTPRGWARARLSAGSLRSHHTGVSAAAAGRGVPRRGDSRRERGCGKQRRGSRAAPAPGGCAHARGARAAAPRRHGRAGPCRAGRSGAVRRSAAPQTGRCGWAARRRARCAAGVRGRAEARSVAGYTHGPAARGRWTAPRVCVSWALASCCWTACTAASRLCVPCYVLTARPAKPAHDAATFCDSSTSRPCLPSRISFMKLMSATHTIGDVSTPLRARARVSGDARRRHAARA
jgi:hypothetical protein